MRDKFLLYKLHPGPPVWFRGGPVFFNVRGFESISQPPGAAASTSPQTGAYFYPVPQRDGMHTNPPHSRTFAAAPFGAAFLYPVRGFESLSHSAQRQNRRTHGGPPVWYFESSGMFFLVKPGLLLYNKKFCLKNVYQLYHFNKMAIAPM